MSTHTLDVSALACPMTWVRTKLELEGLAPGDVLSVRCRATVRIVRR